MNIFQFRQSFLLLIFSLVFPYLAKAQDFNPVTHQNFWQLNDSSYLFKADSTHELWLKDKSLEIWKLNEKTEIFTFLNSKLRLWRYGNQLTLWTFSEEINDWKISDNLLLNYQKINDSISFSVINDSIKWLEIKGRPSVCKSSPYIYVWNRNHTGSKNLLNDTIDFYPVNDTSRLWIYKDQTVIWNRNKSIKVWKISNSTIVWTIDPHTEFWKAGNNYNLWTRANVNAQWEQNQKIQPKKLDGIFDYWPVKKDLILLTNPETLELWNAHPEKSIWNLGDSLKIWRLPPPKIVKKDADTVVIEKIVKKAELLDASRAVKLWTVNDSMKFFQSQEKTELWRLNSNVKLWKISDSTLIWNIGKNTKVSMISDTLTVWNKKEGEFDWKIDSVRKPINISQQLMLLEINDSSRFTRIKDTNAVWNSFGSVRMITRSNAENIYVYRDTMEFWEANDSTKLWIGKYDESGQVWERNKRVNILNINDSTKIWQLNENVRLSIISGKLKIWRQGVDDPNITWRETKEFKREKINDTIRIWQINPTTIIWESTHKIEVWEKNKLHEIYRLNDTSLVYTFSTAQVPPKMGKPKFWSFLGTGKMDMAQVWFDQWAKGGENSISTLFIVNLQANYMKKKVKWDNDFEYRYGFIKPGTKTLRKNEDKIKLNSVFNYYAFKKWYYGFTVTGQSQFFKGYKYLGDTARQVVSDFLAPLYFTAALGMNYFPVKQLSVFFSPLTNKTTYVRDTTLINQESYGVDPNEKAKHEPGLIVKSILNWNITKNINVLSKLDLFTRYNDLNKYNVDWETTFTFKFSKLVQATLNTHLVYDPNVLIKQSDGTETTPVQFKEVFSIGLFYKI